MGTRIKGTTLIARLRYLEETAGAELKARVLETLDASDREQLGRLVLPVREYPLELVDRLDRAIARALAPARPPAEVYRMLGRASADRNTRDFHSGYAVGDPHQILKRVAALRSQYYDDGVTHVVDEGPGKATIEIVGAASITDSDCESSAGFVERLLERAAGQATVRHVKCAKDGGDRCVFECRWG